MSFSASNIFSLLHISRYDDIFLQFVYFPFTLLQSRCFVPHCSPRFISFTSSYQPRSYPFSSTHDFLSSSFSSLHPLLLLYLIVTALFSTHFPFSIHISMLPDVPPCSPFHTPFPPSFPFTPTIPPLARYIQLRP